jgi:hypothetical protein
MAPFRVFEEGDQQHAVIALHGWLTQPVVGELANVVAKRGIRARVDVSHLVGADHAGVVALRLLRRAGFLLTGASPYIDLLIG